jgi:porphobilinogen synthase
MRAMVRETQLNRDGLIQPLFIVPGENVVTAIGSMPGINRYSVDAAVRECRELDALGVRGVLLFGVPDEKDATATGNYDPNGLEQEATRAITATAVSSMRRAMSITIARSMCWCSPR